jgi:hypothetical protein
MHSIPFTANEKNYEVRLTTDGATVRLRAFAKDEGKPANGYIYSVDINTIHDLKVLAEIDVIKALIKTAQDDVIQKRWENLLLAIESLKK